MVTKLKTDGTTVTTRSTSETGHAKNAASFKDIIKGVTDFGDKYQPSNQYIKIWNLGLKKEQVDKAMDEWGTTKQNYNDAENERTKIFSEMGSYSTRITGTLSSSANISALTLKDAKSIMSKIRGTRSAKSKAAAEAAIIAGTESPRTSSVSQLSYDSKLVHFTALRKLVAAQPTYLPNEADLTLAALEIYENRLRTANDKVISARSALIDARNNRDLHLYHEDTGVIALSKLIKNYVKGVFTASHVNYKKINGIPFKLIKDKASSLK